TIDNAKNSNIHGLTRTLISNMIIGVSTGFEKTLEINGVGYKATKQGNKLVLSLGYSHPVEFVETDEIKLDVPNANTVIVKGIDKQRVGQIAAEIREKRLPEPYKGKGIKYNYETIRRKEGKAGAKK
ncbi:MAG: 50S ribosomal protein L6, partial [Bacteroidales bacterium]